MSHDLADGQLLDVSGVSIADLESTDMESALTRSLERILASNDTSNFNSFNSSIA